MTVPGRADLSRPRDLGALLADSAAIYRKHFWTFLAIAAVVVVPVNAIVLGLGLGEFTGGYDSSTGLDGKNPASAYVPVVVQLLVIGPLVAAMALNALLEISAGRKPRAIQSIQAGLDAFAPVFWPVLIALAIEILTIPTVVIPLLLLFRLYLVPQVVVMEGKRGTDALRGSWERTRGFTWRVIGAVLVVQLAFQIIGGLVATPLYAVAKSADSEALSLAGGTLGQTLAVAPIGIFAALLYFDLGARRRQAPDA